ncbi:MAG: helicase HerA domain-containing protein [Candidatus Bathyarchaeia archaeon]
MSERTIRIAEDFSLNVHDHLIERGLGILGMRGSGKSYTSGVVAEELSKIGIPYIIIDLMGEYYSLRERFPVLIVALGSPKYADVRNVSPEKADVIAENAVKSGVSLILDLKFGTMLDRFAFLARFLEALYHTEEKLKRPLVLIMDEAHRITPEKGVIKLKEVKRFQSKVEYWVYELGATGRHYGVGFIVIARRVAEISKMTLTQAELKIVHKNVDPIDLERLREYGLPPEILDQVKRFEAGDAVVIGLEEPKIIHVKQRVCSHGARTPLAKPVETPDLAKAIRSLSKLIKAPPAPPTKVPERLLGELEARRKQVEDLRGQVSAFKREIVKLTDERDALRKERERLLSEVADYRERLDKLNVRVEQLEARVAITDEDRAKYSSEIERLKGQLAEAVELEGRFEQLREVWGNLKDFLIESGNALGLELIPSDISEIIEERNRYKQELERYLETDRLKEERVQEILEDRKVREWVRNAKDFLSHMLRSRGALPKVLRAAIGMDPEVVFFPEDLQTGITASTNRDYLNQLVKKGLLWRVAKGARTGYRNCFEHWVGTNIRKIRPLSPDEAVKRVCENLENHVLR